ncbi:MAG: CPBP family intramembrane glutamic endopeptidase [Polyangiaceae bacterium]|jgi:membrane protease YdiL (CAAX protease family)
MTLAMRCAGAVFVAVVFVVSSAASYLAFSPERAARTAFWLLAEGPTVVLATIAAAWAERQGLLRGWMTPRWGDFTCGLLGALLLFAIAWGFARAAAPVGSTREIWLVSLYGQIGDPRELRAHAGAVATALIVASAAEEVLWRGMITQLLADRFGSRLAWLWAAGLYAAACVPTAVALGSSAGPNPVIFLAALGGGLLWGGMARSFGRLAPGILAHALFDWAAIMMFPLWGSTWRR